MARVKWPVEKPPRHPGRPRKPRHPKPPPPERPAAAFVEPRCTCGHSRAAHGPSGCIASDGGGFSSGCWCTAYSTEPGAASGGDPGPASEG